MRLFMNSAWVGLAAIALAGCHTVNSNQSSCSNCSSGSVVASAPSGPTPVMTVKEIIGKPNTFVRTSPCEGKPCAEAGKTVAIEAKPIGKVAKNCASNVLVPNALVGGTPVAPGTKVGQLPADVKLPNLDMPTETVQKPGATTEMKVPARVTSNEKTPATNLVLETPAKAEPRPGKIPSFMADARWAHDDQFKWIVGELYYSNTKKAWQVRYDGIDSEDSYGGSVTIVGAENQLEQMSDGQLVRIEGELLNKDKMSAPPYRVVRLTPMK